MTSEGLGEMFEGDSADMCGTCVARVDGGTSGHFKRAQMGSEDPHRREWNFGPSVVRAPAVST